MGSTVKFAKPTNQVGLKVPSQFAREQNVATNIFGRVCVRAFRKQLGFILLLAFIFFVGIPARGAPTRFDWEARQWLKDSGLPDNSVTCLLQTRDHFLWVGTAAGLARFDGQEFTQFNEGANRSLNVSALYEDSSGRLWVCTQNDGLLVVSNRMLISFESRRQLPGDNITSITQDQQGNLWIGTSAGLARIQNDSVTRFNTADGLPDNFVSAIHCARSGALWVTTRKGMCELRGDHFARMEFQTQGLGPNPEFLGVYEDDKGNVWAFGDTFLINLKDGKRLNNFRGGDAASYRIWSLCEGRQGHLWISTSGQGIFSFADGHFTPVVFRDKMLSSDVRTVLEDDAGDIWLGTFGSGLIRMRQKSWQFLGENAGLPNEAASCVVSDAEGHVYAGFLRGGVFVGNRGHFDAVGKQFGLATENLVTSICVASNSDLWISTYGDGVYELNGNALQHWTTENGLSDNVVLALCADDSGGLWIGSRSGELQRLKAGNFVSFGRSNGLSGNPITSLVATDSRILVGTEAGTVLQSDGTRFQIVPMPPKLKGKPVRALFEDSAARIWIGADNVGLACVGGNESRLFDANNGFPDVDVRSIIADSNGNLWVSTEKGIWLIRKSTISPALPETINPQQVFAETAGLPGPNLPGGPGVTAAPDGTLYFASSHGVVEFNPKTWRANDGNLKPALEQVVLNGEPLSIPKAEASGRPETAAGMLQFHSQIHSLEFKFTAVDLGFPEKLRFQHFLEGFDSDWVDNGNDRAVHYGRLPFGKYRFRVRVSRGDNVWHEMSAPFAFQLNPPLWRSDGALASFAILAIGLVALGVRQVYHRRLRHRLAQLAQQQAMEKERMRIAQNMHDELGSKLTRVCYLSELVLSGKESTGENLRSIATTSRKLLQNLDEIVWAVNPQNDTLESLAFYLAQYASEYFQGTDVALDLKIPDDFPHCLLSSETRHNLFLAFEEAISNVLKHSSASEVRVEMMSRPDQFITIIRDNGRGFIPRNGEGELVANGGNGTGRFGNGLRNMKKRLSAIGGECRLESAPEQGTTVILQLSLPAKNNHD